MEASPRSNQVAAWRRVKARIKHSSGLASMLGHCLWLIRRIAMAYIISYHIIPYHSCALCIRLTVTHTRKRQADTDFVRHSPATLLRF